MSIGVRSLLTIPSVPCSVLVESSSLQTVSTLLQRRVDQEITDFDLHLDDITCDWANLNLNALVRSFEAA